MPNPEQLLYQTDKSSHQRCSKEEAALKNFTIFTGHHLCWSLFFKLKKILQHRCFPVGNFLKTSILKNIWLRMLLN